MAERLINTDAERTWNDAVMDKIYADNSTVSVPTEMTNQCVNHVHFAFSTSCAQCAKAIFLSFIEPVMSIKPYVKKKTTADTMP